MTPTLNREIELTELTEGIVRTTTQTEPKKANKKPQTLLSLTCLYPYNARTPTVGMDTTIIGIRFKNSNTSSITSTADTSHRYGLLISISNYEYHTQTFNIDDFSLLRIYKVGLQKLNMHNPSIGMGLTKPFEQTTPIN